MASVKDILAQSDAIIKICQAAFDRAHREGGVWENYVSSDLTRAGYSARFEDIDYNDISLIAVIHADDGKVSVRIKDDGTWILA